MPSPILFSTKPYAYLAEQILTAANGRLDAGNLFIRDFPDGEHYHRIDSEVRGRDIWIVGGTTDDTNTLELFDIAQGCVQYGAYSLTIIIPYFGYSTMERSVKDGEIVKAKNRALMFSSIPRTPLGNKVILFDLHSEGIPYYFNSDIQTHHIHCEELITAIARESAGNDFVLAATDAGRAKWVESMANRMGVHGAFIYKKRLSGTETEVMAINANVANRKVIIYDDMIRTGGSLVEAAKAYKAAGAAEISVITTHGLFTNNALQKIADSGIINKITSLDTHPNAVLLQHPLLHTRSIAPLIIKRLLTDEPGD